MWEEVNLTSCNGVKFHKHRSFFRTCYSHFRCVLWTFHDKMVNVKGNTPDGITHTHDFFIQCHISTCD